MARPLGEYGAADWLRLRPVTHAWKGWRYARTDARFLGLPARCGDVAAARARAAGQRVLVTVAFEDAECLALQLAALRRFVPHGLHLVADNSQADAAAARNAAVAGAAGAAWLRLPPNPWTGRNPSRSHGAAMNWVWRHVLRPAAPEAFGFLDQDLFPTAPDDPFAALAQHAFHGDLRRVGARWFLWAGYCFYRHAAVAARPLDFGLDWFAGLDTGGANWAVLYRDADPDAWAARPIRMVPALEGVALARAPMEWRGTWLHEVGFMGETALKGAKRAAVRARVEAALAGA